MILSSELNGCSGRLLRIAKPDQAVVLDMAVCACSLAPLGIWEFARDLTRLALAREQSLKGGAASDEAPNPGGVDAVVPPAAISLDTLERTGESQKIISTSMSRVCGVCVLFVFAQRGKWEAPIVRPSLPDFAEHHNRDCSVSSGAASHWPTPRHICVLVWHITGRRLAARRHRVDLYRP